MGQVLGSFCNGCQSWAVIYFMKVSQMKTLEVQQNWDIVVCSCRHSKLELHTACGRYGTVLRNKKVIWNVSALN